jgi:hypothetical protein
MNFEVKELIPQLSKDAKRSGGMLVLWHTEFHVQRKHYMVEVELLLPRSSSVCFAMY